MNSRGALVLKLIAAAVTLAVAALLPKIKHGYPWNLDVAFYAFGFLLLGNLLYPLIDRFYRFVSGKKRTEGVLIAAAAVVVTLAGTFLYKLNLSSIRMVSTADAVYGNFPIFLLAALFGCLFTAALSILLDLILPRGKKDVLLFIGQNTFCILAIHKPIIRPLLGIIPSIVRLPEPVVVILTCIGALVISCLLSLLVNRYVPLLAGKIPKKEGSGA